MGKLRLENPSVNWLDTLARRWGHSSKLKSSKKHPARFTPALEPLEPREVPALQVSSLCGHVYVDANDNGIREAGEEPIAGVLVTLSGTDQFGQPVNRTTTTDGVGRYCFLDLFEGTYTVTETQPAGFLDGKDTQGTPGTGTTQNDRFVSIFLPGGVHGDDNDFGELRPAALGDFVWHDLNADGIQDGGEPGIPGVVVSLTGVTANGTLLPPRVMATDANGGYLFTGLLPATYTVTVGTPTGFTASPSLAGSDLGIDSNGSPTSTTLASGQNDLTLDFGFYKLASLGDFVWFDQNQNGTQDGGEPGVGGATVQLKNAAGGVIATTTTNANGLYSFTGLRPGTYSVQFTLPTGYDRFTTANVGGDATDSDADPALGFMTAPVTLASGQHNPTLDAGVVRLTPAIDIEKLVRVNNGPDFDADNPTGPTARPGDTVTFTFVVSNPGQVELSGVVVTDREVDPVTNQSVGPAYNPAPVLSGGFNVGDADRDNRLDPGEVWRFSSSTTVAAPPSGFPVALSEISRYLLIGTTSNAIAKAVNVQNGDLGADVIVLSTEINDNVDFNNNDVFLHNAGSHWVNYDNLPNTQPDYLPGAAQVGEGVSWSGDVALTSPNAAFDMSNVELYGQVGVVAASGNPVSSVSNTLYFPNGVGDGVNPSGGQSLPPNGVTPNATAAMAALRAQLDAFESWVTDLAPERTLSPGNGLPTQLGIENVGVFTLNIDQFDTNGDGIAVIDILVENGNGDFKITNSNWIIQGSGSTFAIFRILGNSNLVLNQSTILIGDGGIGNCCDGESGLGAIFVKANDYNNGRGGRSAGESLQSSDTVFSFNDTVLNGVGFYDLIVFDEQNTDPEFDNGTTELKINNGQGCSQFISPKINFNNVRFERCTPVDCGGEDEQHKNIADVRGVSASGVAATDADAAHWLDDRFGSSPPVGWTVFQLLG